MGMASMLRERREHSVGAASQLRGISTLSLSTQFVLSLLSVVDALGFVLVNALGFVLVNTLGLVLVNALGFVLVNTLFVLVNTLGFVLVEVLFGSLWSHCRQIQGTLLASKPS